MPRGITDENTRQQGTGFMTARPTTGMLEQKQAIRRQAHANRDAQPDKDELSRQIVTKFLALPEYADAQTVMFYVDARSEVRTRLELRNSLQSNKRIVVPYCVDDRLH